MHVDSFPVLYSPVGAHINGPGIYVMATLIISV